MKYLQSWFDKKEHIPVPRWYGRSYSDYARALDVYYPIPLNYLMRYCLSCSWGFLRVFWWVGLIDTPRNCIFIWGDFYRIKTRK